MLHTVSMWGGEEAAAARFHWAQLSMSRSDFSAAASHAASCVDLTRRADRGTARDRRLRRELTANAYAIWGMCKLKLDANDPEVLGLGHRALRAL